MITIQEDSVPTVGLFVGQQDSKSSGVLLILECWTLKMDTMRSSETSATLC
jgi:hypothetical protein